MTDDAMDFVEEPSAPFEALSVVTPVAPEIAPDADPETLLVAAVMGDPDGNIFSQHRTLPPSAFQLPEPRRIWEAFTGGIPIDDHGALIQATGVSFSRIALLGSLDRMGTSAAIHAAEIRRRYKLRLVQALASRMALAQEIDAEDWKKRLDEISAASEDVKQPLVPLTEFSIPLDDDRSVLLGNRFLNRGDGGILVSNSGMGKSSMSIQMAVSWALGLPAFGINPNGPMRSVIVQSEDSEGDIAEVWESVKISMKLTEAQVAQVKDRVVLVTDRVNRGERFIGALRRHIRRQKPDLVWINPLQAFMEGDITKSQDLGKFLREGLNSLNEPASFGYILVHHTTKPPNDKDRSEATWSEQMYQMAGGAELINWARFIISLKPTEEEGLFNLILAKRGKRAGITKKVAQGAGFRDEPVTKIALRHAARTMQVPGREKPLPVIFWESGEHSTEVAKPEPRKRVSSSTWKDYNGLWPKSKEEAIPFNEIYRRALQFRPVQKSQLYELVDQGVDEGRLGKTLVNGVPAYWLT